MAVFMLNVCKFNSCGLTFKSLGHLIQHIEETHIDYDPHVVERQEQQQPACIALSYVLRFLTDAARRENALRQSSTSSQITGNNNPTNSSINANLTTSTNSAVVVTTNNQHQQQQQQQLIRSLSTSTTTSLTSTTMQSTTSSQHHQQQQQQQQQRTVKTLVPTGSSNHHHQHQHQHQHYRRKNDDNDNEGNVNNDAADDSDTDENVEEEEDDDEDDDETQSNDSWATARSSLEDYSGSSGNLQPPTVPAGQQHMEHLTRYGYQHRNDHQNSATNNRHSGVDKESVCILEEKPFGCPVPGCKKRYKNINGVKYHTKNGHKNEKIPVANLLHFNHKSQHHQSSSSAAVASTMNSKKSFRCGCGKSYKTSYGLKNHVALIHATDRTIALSSVPPAIHDHGYIKQEPDCEGSLGVLTPAPSPGSYNHKYSEMIS